MGPGYDAGGKCIDYTQLLPKAWLIANVGPVPGDAPST